MEYLGGCKMRLATDDLAVKQGDVARLAAELDRQTGLLNTQREILNRAHKHTIEQVEAAYLRACALCAVVDCLRFERNTAMIAADAAQEAAYKIANAVEAARSEIHNLERMQVGGVVNDVLPGRLAELHSILTDLIGGEQ